MSHLLVKKTAKGKFAIYDKNKKSFVGKPSTDKEAITKESKARDIREDK